jgi:3D (Asp-Asp-Asp) domain-containing protein
VHQEVVILQFHIADVASVEIRLSIVFFGCRSCRNLSQEQCLASIVNQLPRTSIILVGSAPLFSRPEFLRWCLGILSLRMQHETGQALHCIKQILGIIVVLVFFLLVSVACAQTLTVTMTAYSSEALQTDSTPSVTSTGETVRPGIVAVSRDLLATALPYGTKLRVVEIKQDPRACGGWDPGVILEVQDTMHRRKRNQVDLWVPSREEALQWGRCEVVLEIVELPQVSSR